MQVQICRDKKKYVSISSSSDENKKVDAEILEKYYSTNPDVAILKIGKVPPGREAAKLGKHRILCLPQIEKQRIEKN